MRIDLHLHTHFSPDADTVPEWLVRRAIERGYDQIAITEHVDPPNDPITPGDFPRFQEAKREILRLRALYPAISLLFGAEVGEYHRNRDTVATWFSRIHPDYVIASIHMVREWNVSVPMPEIPDHKLIRQYYIENLAMLDVPGIHTLGHLGIFKRYLAGGYDDSFCTDLIDDILRTMIDRGICLEINSSALNRPFGELIPEPEVLHRYRALGGNLLTLGSDSHHPGMFDASYESAVARLRSLGINRLYRRVSMGWVPMSL